MLSLNVYENLFNWIVVLCYILFLKVLFSVWIMWVAWKLLPWVWKHPTRKLYLYMTRMEQRLTSLSERTPSLWSLLMINETRYFLFSIYILARLLIFITSLICCWVNWIIGPCPAVNAHWETEVCLVGSPQWHFLEIRILWIITCRSLSYRSVFGSGCNWHWWSEWHRNFPQPAPVSPSATTHHPFSPAQAF